MRFVARSTYASVKVEGGPGDAPDEAEDDGSGSRKRRPLDWPHYWVLFSGLLVVSLLAEYIGAIAFTKSPEKHEEYLLIGSGTVVSWLQNRAAEAVAFRSDAVPGPAEAQSINRSRCQALLQRIHRQTAAVTGAGEGARSKCAEKAVFQRE